MRRELVRRWRRDQRTTDWPGGGETMHLDLVRNTYRLPSYTILGQALPQQCSRRSCWGPALDITIHNQLRVHQASRG